MKLHVESLTLILAFAAVNSLAPQQVSVPRRPLPNAPFLIDSAEQGQIRVSSIKGLSHPWSLVFLPTGEMLVTERPGRLRIVRDGILDPKPISGVPEVQAHGLSGLMDIALHPSYSKNHLVYLTFTKPMGERGETPALVRGRLAGFSLDRLVRFLVQLGSDVEIVVKPRSRTTRRARVMVA